ncbi:MAG: hypothetical protein LUF87_02715 [Alistipes sp.]|nr:hypothetical protein [Alistipes sp.]
MFDRFNLFHYDADLSKNYAQPGDSLFLHYHYKAPQASNDLPELASEWSYHNENGNVFENGLRYAVNCFAPSDDVLEAFIRDYFSEFGVAQMPEDYLDVLPDNHVYHLLQAHTYGLRDLIIPSELDKAPVSGPYGEKFDIPSSDLNDIRFCTNGVIYGTNKVLVPAIFTGITMPLFKYPEFTWFSLAFNKRSLYQMANDPNNRHTLFIIDDTDMRSAGYTYNISTQAIGEFQLYNGNNTMADNGITNLVLRGFVLGDVPPSYNSISQGLRFYVSKNFSNYFYSHEGDFFDCMHSLMEVKNTFDTENGTVYQIEAPFSTTSGGMMQRMNQADVTTFRALMVQCGLISGGALQFVQTEIAFVPTNDAMQAAEDAGMLPDPDDREALRAYLMYYFSPLHQNKLDHYILPGLGPNGMTDSAFETVLETHVEYHDADDAKTIRVSWDPDDPYVMTLTDMAGNSIRTNGDIPNFYNNGTCYTLEECFDYRTMFGN